MMARAIATLCCSHQDNWLGLLCILCASQTFSSALIALSFCSAFGTPWYDKGKVTWSRTGILGIRLYAWKTNQIFFERNCAFAFSSSEGRVFPLRIYSPLVGVSRSQMIFINVDFPDHEGPMMAKKSPSLMVRSIPKRTFCIISFPFI